MNLFTASSFVFVLFLLGGCSRRIPSPAERHSTLSALAHEYNLSLKPITTSRFTLMSAGFTEGCGESKRMNLYIEGDGFAWKTRSQLSDDPTPITPLAARLMAIDEGHCKLYLARPCQYVNDLQCNSDDWSSHRFSPKVVETYREILDQMKQRYGIESFTLVGYSGGGAVAVLMAGDRNDIGEIITVAGNLDTDAWVKYHGLSPLDGSINPSKRVETISHIPQMHFIGNEDTTVPKEIFFSFLGACKNPQHIRYRVIESVTHTQGWEKIWKENR